MPTFAEGPWSGSPKIILGIDIGTTQSAVAFAYLEPGVPQYLHRVTAWPGQEAQIGESKIPTLVYYDSAKKAVSFGAESLKPETVERAEDECWQLARHFKLHLHPEDIKNKHNLCSQPLPWGIALHTIYTDFMGYLLKHTKHFFESRVVDGQKIWANHCEEMTVVLTHPNGWGTKEQEFLRQAAAAANYVPADKSQSHIRFVSEAEASVHFCMLHSDLQNCLEPNITFVVCDAGGSTVDTVAYRVMKALPNLEIEEVKAPACILAGGIFVDGEFEQYLARILTQINNLEEDRVDYLRQGVNDFSSISKRRFDDVKGQYRVMLGSIRLKREDLGIRRGVITLEGGIVKGFFDKCITQITESVRQQISGLEFKHIILVGGFGDSLYLQRSLIDEFGKGGCTVNVANESTTKAVAEGGVIWYSKRIVFSRATRVAYGVNINVPYDPNEPSHKGRQVYRHTAGYDYLIDGWSEIIGKNVIVESTREAIRETYWRSYRTANSPLGKFRVDIFSYTGGGTPGPWLRDSQGKLNEGFARIGEVEIALDHMRGALKRRVGRDGDFYYLVFTLLFMIRSPEFQFAVEWEENGRVLTSPLRFLP